MMITSKTSTTLKRVRGLLTSRKKRQRAGLTVVEGPRSVLDLLASRRRSSLVRQILMSSEDDGASTRYAEAIRDVLSQRQDGRDQCDPPQILTVHAPLFNALADTVTPQGILAVVSIPEFANDDDEQRQHTPSQSSSPLYLVLDGVADPGNVGTLLRSAVATGVTGVLTLPGTADPYGPKCIRGSMACTFVLPVRACEDWKDVVDFLSSRQQREQHGNDATTTTEIYAATMWDEEDNEDDNDVDDGHHHGGSTTSRSIPHYHVDWTTDASTTITALVIGGEGRGLSPPVRRALRDGTARAVHVPMLPGSVESLNAGVCGSVILFERLRQQQCRHGPVGNHTVTAELYEDSHPLPEA